MRLRISHRIICSWRTPAKAINQILRLTPRNHDGQRIASWRIDLDGDYALNAMEDTFGNLAHTLSVAGPLTRIALSVHGDVETFDTAGVLREPIERFPPQFYLRTTTLTTPDDAAAEFARYATSGSPDPLSRMHALMRLVSETMTLEPAVPAGRTMAESLAQKKGTGRDLAHLFIGCARHAGVPARMIGGYYFAGGPDGSETHAWAEAWIEGLGWVGFDPAHCVCPAESHVSVARALDWPGACPVRSAHSGGEDEEISSELGIAQQKGQRQN